MEYARKDACEASLMDFRSPKQPGQHRTSLGVDDLKFRELRGGTIRHVIHESGDIITAQDAPEVVLRIAGRGRIVWPDAPEKDRSGAAILLPPEQSLEVQGKLRALRLALPGLVVRAQTGPLSEVLVCVLCPRAWRSAEPIAEVALSLIRLLIEEELCERAGCDA